MVSLFLLIDQILSLYSFIVIISVVLHMLMAFNIINPYQKLVAIIYDACRRLTDPAFNFFRRYIPPVGGMDLSPLVVILLISFARNLIQEYVFRAF